MCIVQGLAAALQAKAERAYSEEACHAGMCRPGVDPLSEGYREASEQCIRWCDLLMTTWIWQLQQLFWA